MVSIVTPQSAAELLLARRRARASLADYVSYMDLGLIPAAHHRLVIQGLETIARREIDRLMVFMPPGSAKSFYGSQMFPPWYMGNNPSHAILACSHSQPLANRFGRRVRNMFARPDHVALFGVGIAQDSKSASEWSTEKEGEYFAAGVGVGISGRRCDIGLIDDPVKNREDADSLLVQERNWDWYLNDFLPRLKPNAAQIIIQTRWHAGDLAGRILDREAERWKIIELGMEAHTGDPLGRQLGERLWPEWFTDDMVATAKLDARSWNALYQQRPFIEEGDYFKLSWFSDYDVVPDNAHYYGASDYAVTEGHGDFTEHGIFALDAFKNLYVVDWWYGQTTSDVWIERQCDLIQKYEPLTWFGESGPIRRSIEPYLAQRMTERNAYCRIEWLPSISDKPTRCRSFQAMSSMGKVWFPRRASWKARLIEQLTHAFGGQYDDGVDTCSLVGRGLDLIAAPRMKPRWTPEVRSISSDLVEHSWMTS